MKKNLKSHSVQLEQELYTAQIKYKITTKIISILEEHMVLLLTLLAHPRQSISYMTAGLGQSVL